MALTIKHKDQEFGIGDRIKVFQRIKEGDKTRLAFFEGIVIAVKNVSETKSFTVRRIGDGKIGIERIFPLNHPTIEKIEVIKKGTRGTRRAKLYYIRKKSSKEIDKIYWRSNVRIKAKQVASDKLQVTRKFQEEKHKVTKRKKSVKKTSE